MRRRPDWLVDLLEDEAFFEAMASEDLADEEIPAGLLDRLVVLSEERAADELALVELLQEDRELGAEDGAWARIEEALEPPRLEVVKGGGGSSGGGPSTRSFLPWVGVGLALAAGFLLYSRIPVDPGPTGPLVRGTERAPEPVRRALQEAFAPLGAEVLERHPGSGPCSLRLDVYPGEEPPVQRVQLATCRDGGLGEELRRAAESFRPPPAALGDWKGGEVDLVVTP